MSKQMICGSCPFYLQKLQSCPINMSFDEMTSQIDQTKIIELLMVMLSSLHYLVAILYASKVFINNTRNNRYICGLMVFQLVVVKTLKSYIKQYRPESSCESDKYGMPSNHSSAIICQFVWYLWSLKVGIYWAWITY